MSKKEFITSCCGQSIEDCPGCPQGMMLIPKDKGEDANMPDARKIGETIGIKWEHVPFTLDQFEKGLNAEMKEHHDDPQTKVINTDEEAGKVAWAHLKEDPKYYDKLAQIEEDRDPIFAKIDEGTVTVDDFNRLLSESTPESLRDRVRRRPMAQRNTVKSHQDNESGHSDLSLPEFGDRVQPKRKPADRTQNNGRGRNAHRHSARSQKGKPQDHNRFNEAVEFVNQYYGKPLVEYQELLAEIEDKEAVSMVAKRMMSTPGVNRDWLFDVCRCIEHG